MASRSTRSSSARGREAPLPRSSSPAQAWSPDRRRGRALDVRAHPLDASAGALRLALPRRRLDDRARASRRSRSRRAAPSAARPSSTRARATGRPDPSSTSGARPGSTLAGDGFEERLSDVEEMIGVAPVPMERHGPERRAGAGRRRRARLGARAAPAKRDRVPRRVPVRDRLPEQRQGRRPHERTARRL